MRFCQLYLRMKKTKFTGKLKLNKEIEASYRGIDEAKKLIVKDRPSVALAILGVTPSISFNEKEAKDKVLKAAQHNETLRNSLKNSGDQAIITALAQQTQVLQSLVRNLQATDSAA